MENLFNALLPLIIVGWFLYVYLIETKETANNLAVSIVSIARGYIALFTDTKYVLPIIEGHFD
jgi:hypothetical protein